ncbi:MAG: hypothetical protein LKM45_07300 [Wolbachia endosymbiont of Alcedoecus sp.]|nr:hypothetical protein [Wolbachia endosymbiont of Alcedoecus sp.]
MENWIPVSSTGMTRRGHWDDIIGVRMTKKGDTGTTGKKGTGMTREGGVYFSRQRSHKISIPCKFLT